MACSASGIWYSSNYGVNFSQTLASISNWKSIVTNTFASMTTACVTNENVYQAQSTTMLPETVISGLLKSTNGMIDLYGSINISENIDVSGNSNISGNINSAGNCNIGGSIKILNTSNSLNSLEVHRSNNSTIDPSGTYLFYNSAGILGTSYQYPSASTNFIWKIDNSANALFHSVDASAYYLNGVPTKTFVIDHPTKNDNYLVHACLEGPEAGVYYRGEAKIVDNKSTIVFLPDYVESLATNYTTHLTPIYDDNEDEQINLKCSRVKDNKFTVYGKKCSFYWVVYGERVKINVEPLKIHTSVKGEGPYKWIHF